MPENAADGQPAPASRRGWLPVRVRPRVMSAQVPARSCRIGSFSPIQLRLPALAVPQPRGANPTRAPSVLLPEGWPTAPAGRDCGAGPIARPAGRRHYPSMPCRILVVDDSESFRRIAVQLLAARGLQPLPPAGDGPAALAAASADCPDGILLDINLPGQDGFAVAAQIASAVPGVTIVLTSSDTEDVPQRGPEKLRCSRVRPEDRTGDDRSANTVRRAGLTARTATRRARAWSGPKVVEHGQHPAVLLG